MNNSITDEDENDDIAADDESDKSQPDVEGDEEEDKSKLPKESVNFNLWMKMYLKRKTHRF